MSFARVFSGGNGGVTYLGGKFTFPHLQISTDCYDLLVFEDLCRHPITIRASLQVRGYEQI